MIYEIHIKDPSETPIPWWHKVPWLQRESFTFGPGLTILFGPNGSGKSTLLLALARLFHCAQGGVPVITESSIREFTYRNRTIADKTLRSLDSLSVKHDGRIKGFFEAGKRIGAAGGYFDDDFFDDGVRSTLMRGSHGETHLDALARILSHSCEPVADRVGKRVNDLWLSWREQVLAFLAPNAEPGPPTLLLDEPDRSLSIPRRVELWRALLDASKRVQILLASHDSLCLRLPPDRVTYLETEPGYLNRCRAALADPFV